MNSADDNERILRKFEREVLDPFHLSLPLMQRPLGEALYAVMAAYDSTLVSLRAISAQMDEHAIGTRQAIRVIVQAAHVLTREAVAFPP